MQKEYGKHYAKSVDKSREKNFYTVDAEIEVHNSKPNPTYTRAHNKFSDMVSYHYRSS